MIIIVLATDRSLPAYIYSEDRNTSCNCTCHSQLVLLIRSEQALIVPILFYPFNLFLCYGQQLPNRPVDLYVFSMKCIFKNCSSHETCRNMQECGNAEIMGTCHQCASISAVTALSTSQLLSASLSTTSLLIYLIIYPSLSLFWQQTGVLDRIASVQRLVTCLFFLHPSFSIPWKPSFWKTQPFPPPPNSVSSHISISSSYPESSFHSKFDPMQTFSKYE